MKEARLLLVILLACVLAFSAPLFAQEDTLDAEEGTTTAVEDTGKDSGKGTMVFNMGEIVVKDRAVANIENASTSTEITEEEIKQKSQKTLDEALTTVPGFNVYQTQKGQMGFTLRGFRQDKLAILVDGVPFEEVYDGGGGDISRIPIMNASKIIVNRGVSSALYGARGTFGTINVVTKKPEELFAEASVEYGEYQNYSLNVAHGMPVGDFYYWITGSMMNSNGYKVSDKLDTDKRKEWFKKLSAYDVYGYTLGDFTTEELDNYLDDSGKWNHTEYRKYYLNGKIGYNFTDKIEAGISSGYYRNEQLFLGFYPRALASYNDDTSDWSTPGSANSIFNFKAQRAWEWPEDYRYDISPYINAEFGDLDIRASLFYVKQMNVLKYWFDFEHSSTFWDPSKHIEQSYGVYIYPTYKLTSWNKLSAAIHYRIEDFEKQEELTSSFETTKEMQASYVTLALEDEAKFDTGFGDLALTAGCSYDAQKLEEFKDGPPMTDQTIPKSSSTIWGTADAFNPVFGFVYDPIKDLLTIRGSSSMKIEFPNLHQYSDNNDAGVDYELEPEKSYNSNIGFELFFMDRKISFRNDYFYTRFKDKLESQYDPDAIPGNDPTFNIKGRTVQGAESIISFNNMNVADIATLTCSFSYVFTKAKDHDDSSVTYGETVAETPEHQFNVNIVMDFVTKTSLIIWGNYKTNEYVYVMKEDPGLATEPYTTKYYTTEKLHDPLKVNVKVSQKFLENYEVYVKCDNVFDDYNADPFNPGPGRMFYFGANAKL